VNLDDVLGEQSPFIMLFLLGKRTEFSGFEFMLLLPQMQLSCKLGFTCMWWPFLTVTCYCWNLRFFLIPTLF